MRRAGPVFGILSLACSPGTVKVYPDTGDPHTGDSTVETGIPPETGDTGAVCGTGETGDLPETGDSAESGHVETGHTGETGRRETGDTGESRPCLKEPPLFSAVYYSCVEGDDGDTWRLEIGTEGMISEIEVIGSSPGHAGDVVRFSEPVCCAALRLENLSCAVLPTFYLHSWDSSGAPVDQAQTGTLRAGAYRELEAELVTLGCPDAE